MLSIKICLVYYIFLNIVVKIHTLVPLPVVEDNSIAGTEKAIQNTVNDLFAILKIQDVRHKPKLKQFSTLHNFFVSITLIDCDNLDAIVRLSRVNTIDNNTQHFIANINEVLNGDDKSNEENDNDIRVAKYIQNIIKTLKRLKEVYVPKRPNIINTEILKYINFDKNKENINNSKTNEESEDENILDYWQPSGRRIYQGIRAGVKRFPFMASIHFFNKFQCAGSIIKNDLVITSSSCLQIAWNNRFFRENPAFLSVRVGCDFYDFCGDSIAVLEIYFHPQYNPKTLSHNLAIMRLRRKINFRRSHGRVKKIRFDTNPWPLPVNSRITIIGWGAKDSANMVYDVVKNKLSYADLDFFPLDDCQEYYSKDFVTSKNFCAGFYSMGGGACNHDAGGPAIVDHKLMGVISFGSPMCGAAAAPTVFTKLGFYSNWIEEIMDQKTAFNEVKTTTALLPTTYMLYEKPTTKNIIRMVPFDDTPTTTISIDEKEMLREPQEQRFKDFLANLFLSEEIETYLDVSDTEPKQKIIIDKQQTKANNKRMEGGITVKTEPNNAYTYPATTLTDSSDDVEKSNELTTESQQKTTNIENASNDGKSFEEDIINLVNNLDIDELLEPEILLSSAIENDAIRENNNRKQKKVTFLKNVTVSDMTMTEGKLSPDTLISDQNEDNDYEDEGLSIQAEPFTNLNLRDRPNTDNKHDVLSETAMFDLISHAIDEQTKLLNKNKHNLNKKKGYIL